MDKVEGIVGQLRHGLTPDWFGENLEMRNRALGRKAADLIQSQQALIEEMREALKVFGSASDNFDKFWAEETGGQKQIDGDEDEMTTFFTLGVYLHMAPLSAYRRAKALSQKE